LAPLLGHFRATLWPTINKVSPAARLSVCVQIVRKAHALVRQVRAVNRVRDRV